MKHGPHKEIRAEKLAATVQRVGVAGGLFRLVKTLGLALLLLGLAVFLLYIGFPWYIGAALIVIAAGIVAFDVIVLRRTAAVDLNAPNEPVDQNIEPEAGEVLLDTIPAVMQYGKTRSVAVLETGADPGECPAHYQQSNLGADRAFARSGQSCCGCGCRQMAVDVGLSGYHPCATGNDFYLTPA